MDDTQRPLVLMVRSFTAENDDEIFTGFPEDQEPTYPYEDVHEAALACAAWCELLHLEPRNFQLMELWAASASEQDDFVETAEMMSAGEKSARSDYETREFARQDARELDIENGEIFGPAPPTTGVFHTSELPEEDRPFNVEDLKSGAPEEFCPSAEPER